MSVDADAELVELRTVLRDLVALSAIPAAWVGREPATVAAGLADALIGLLQLDFAYVRLCVPDVAGVAEVTRGDAWKSFPRWLERHLAESGRLSAKQIIPDVGGGAGQFRGVVIPIGVGAEGGMVAAACDRADFPAAADLLLLTLAANHAAAGGGGDGQVFSECPSQRVPRPDVVPRKPRPDRPRHPGHQRP